MLSVKRGWRWIVRMAETHRVRKEAFQVRAIIAPTPDLKRRVMVAGTGMGGLALMEPLVPERQHAGHRDQGKCEAKTCSHRSNENKISDAYRERALIRDGIV